jgi:hypothetical protein
MVGRPGIADEMLLIGRLALDDELVVGRPKGEVGRRMKDLSGLEEAGQTGGGITLLAHVEQARETELALCERSWGRRRPNIVYEGW